VIEHLQDLWHRLTAPRATDRDEARQEYVANAIIVGVGSIGLAFTLVMAILYFTVPGLPREPLIGTLASLPLMPLCMWLSRRGWWRIVPVAPILALLGITIYGQWTFGPYNVAIVLYGALVIITLVAYGARGAIVAALASIASYALVGAVTLEQEAPAVSMPVRIIALAASLAIIILLQWFFTDQLKRALLEARTYAGELRQSEQRYRTLFANVPVGLYRTTADGQIVDANPAQVQMLAYPDVEALCKVNASELYVDPEDRERWKTLMERDGVVRDFEAQFARSDGKVIWVNDTARAVRDDAGTVQYFEGSIEDITQRKAAELELKRYQEHLEELVQQRTAELQESEQRYRTLFDRVPVGLYRSTPDGTVIEANEAALSMLGITSLDSAPSSPAESFYLDPRTRERWKALMDEHGVVRDFECQMRRADGTLLWAKDSARAVTDKQGRPLYYEGSLEDISERKRAEEDMRQARAAAEAASQAKSRFLANMSHELRTPLNSIVGFTQLVRRRAADILLNLSKIEAGRTDLELTEFELNPLVAESLATIQPLVKSNRVDLVKDIPPDLPGCFTDRDKLRQILLNLLGNAAKFTEQGAITIRARHQNGIMLLSVSDTGIGIPAEDLDLIFEAFHQVDASSTRSHGGTGLGLTISRQLAQLLGGDITVESEPGRGSTFTVALPLRLETERAMPHSPGATLTTREQAHGPATDRPLVLAIDDDPNVIYLLDENLSDAGYEVIGVTSGSEGLQRAQSMRPEAIILDILMSPRDGWQILRELKRSEHTRDIPVIVLSIVDDRKRGYRLGAADYLIKPFDRDTILDALARVISPSIVPRRTRLLVVDDDPDVLEHVRRLLRGEPYEIETVPDAQQARRAIAERRPDIVLLDALLPDMDGFALAEEWRSDQRYRDVPVILLAEGYPGPRDALSLRECVDRIVDKRSLSRAALLEDLRHALQACRQASENGGEHE